MVFKHIDGVICEATFSGCGRFRYSLTIEMIDSAGTDTVCVIMQNPSVADSEIADKSVQFLEKLIFLEEYPEFSNTERIIIVNQFGFIQTKDFDSSDSYIGTDNDESIRKAIESSEIVLVAWGANNKYAQRKEIIDKIIKQSGQKKLLQTKKHPSRGTYSDFIKDYKF